MTVIRAGLEILSLSLGLITGYFVGKWDSRESDLAIFKELSAGIAAWVHYVIAEKEDEEMPEFGVVEKSRDEWFADTLARIRQERSRSWKLALALASLTLIVFSVSQLVE